MLIFFQCVHTHTFPEAGRIRTQTNRNKILPQRVLFSIFISQDKWSINLLPTDDNREEGHVFLHDCVTLTCYSTALISAVYLIKLGRGDGPSVHMQHHYSYRNIHSSFSWAYTQQHAGCTTCTLKLLKCFLLHQSLDRGDRQIRFEGNVTKWGNVINLHTLQVVIMLTLKIIRKKFTDNIFLSLKYRILQNNIHPKSIIELGYVVMFGHLQLLVVGRSWSGLIQKLV